jgi:hypothetical protein
MFEGRIQASAPGFVVPRYVSSRSFLGVGVTKRSSLFRLVDHGPNIVFVRKSYF